MVVVLLACSLFVIGCEKEEKNSADSKQRKATAKLTDEAQKQIGMPAIVNFQERKLAKMIFELRDKEDLVCYAYLVNKMSGKLVFFGKCIGFGLPYSVQFTNPMRAVELDKAAGRSASAWYFGTLPQADPNGLFMPSGLSATWLMMIDPVTKTPRPVYIEPEIVVAPFPLN